MKRLALAVLVLATAAVGGLASADDIPLESWVPVVVKTVPAAGADDVDPKTKEIKITFSKDMKEDSWSLAYKAEKDQFPKIDGKIKYADKRTLVVPVKLEAGKTYALWVNTETNTGCKDADGRAAVPYLLVFKTKK
jgi:hypothetical protein